MPDARAPELIFVGGTDNLQLEEGGTVYHPGDVIPRLSTARRIAMQAAGIRFRTQHHNPPVTPDGKPSATAAVEAAAADASDAAQSKQQPRRAAAKE